MKKYKKISEQLFWRVNPKVAFRRAIIEWLEAYQKKERR